MTLKSQIVSTPEGRFLWHQQRAVLATTELICELMERSGISREELALKLIRPKSYVTRMLDGQTALTLRDVSDVFTVLGYQFEPSVGEQVK